VPLDGSGEAERLLSVVHKMVEGSTIEVTLFGVGRPPRATARRRNGLARPLPIATVGTAVRAVIGPEPPTYVETRDQAVERCEHELLEYLDGVARQLQQTGIRVQTAARLGEPAHEICDFAEREEFDAIVMATHGRAGLGRTLHGSVTAAVVREGVAPVLVVPPGPG
jgi:nucleotide-binding universal stress UspA family protein